MGQAVHFGGVEGTVEAYELLGIGPWSVISQKCMIHATEGVGIDDVEVGAEMLRVFLTKLARRGTKTTFTLQVHKVSADEDITKATPVYREFNFALHEPGEFSVERSSSLNPELDKRIARIEAALDKMAQDEDEEEESGGIGGIVKGLMADPGIRQAIAVGAMNLVKNVFPMNNGHQAQQPAKVAGTSQRVSLLDQQQVEKVQQAVSVLATVDRGLGDNLMKIARLAENEPEKYFMFAKML